MVQIHVSEKAFWERVNFLPELPLSKRPLNYNGLFPLVKVDAIERLDRT